jgi:hypothetical protein
VIPLSAQQLSESMTFIREFMLDRSRHTKTFRQLVTIFDSCVAKMANDSSNDLRILRFTSDMEAHQWTADIVITRTNGIVTDGIHRGVAYLRSLDKTGSEQALPKVLAQDN